MKPKTWNRKLEPMGVAKTDKTCGLTGTDSGLTFRESLGRAFGWVRDRTDLFLQSKPGTLAGYPDLLLRLGDYYPMILNCLCSAVACITNQAPR